MKNYMIGCNYWGSRYGIDMWKYWDEASIDNDLKTLCQYGVRYLRVFPNWRDFQPIQSLKAWGGKRIEYRMPDDKKLENEFGIDPVMMDHFRTFCAIAEKYHIKLVVSIITGWMSGRLFVPPAFEGKNLFTDPEALRWQARFAQGFVRGLKDCQAIESWCLGNECNCMAVCDNNDSAYLWALNIRNAIKAEDNTRPVMSGMHSLHPGITDTVWRIQDQGEITDIMTTHPYPSPTIGCDCEPLNTMRVTLGPTAQTVMYSSIGKKPAMIQESGTFTEITGCRELSADFMRCQILSGWANGSLGYLWWCAHEQIYLNYPPYTWGMMERELGILDENFEPKPVALEMKRMTELMETLPFDELPPAQVDAICVVPQEIGSDWLGISMAAYTLSKQAGYNMRFVYMNQEIPDAPLYILPSLHGWAPIFSEALDTLIEKAKNGAHVLISTSNGHLSMFGKLTGLKSRGMFRTPAESICRFDDVELPFTYGTKLLLESVDAHVIAQDDDGTVIFAEKACGKGKILYLNFPVEENLFKSVGNFTDDTKPYYKIYQKAAEGLAINRVAVSANPYVVVTNHKVDDETTIVIAINYSDKEQAPGLTIDGKAACVYGNADCIPSCDAAIFIVKKA